MHKVLLREVSHTTGNIPGKGHKGLGQACWNGNGTWVSCAEKEWLLSGA